MPRGERRDGGKGRRRAGHIGHAGDITGVNDLIALDIALWAFLPLHIKRRRVGGKTADVQRRARGRRINRHREFVVDRIAEIRRVELLKLDKVIAILGRVPLQHHFRPKGVLALAAQRIVTGVKEIDHRIGLIAQIGHLDNIRLARLCGKTNPVGVATVMEGMGLLRAVGRAGLGAGADIVIFKAIATDFGRFRGRGGGGIGYGNAINPRDKTSIDHKVGAG